MVFVGEGLRTRNECLWTSSEAYNTKPPIRESGSGVRFRPVSGRRPGGVVAGGQGGAGLFARRLRRLLP